MGYRSEVGLVLDSASASALDALAKLNSDVRELLEHSKELTKCESEHRYYWEWIKWYDTDPGVSELEKFLGQLPESSYGFIRLGEEASDIEEMGFPFKFDMHVTRKLMV